MLLKHTVPNLDSEAKRVWNAGLHSLVREEKERL